MNMFARFDENPAMTLRVIKETKRYGRTDAQTDARTDGRTDNVKPVYPLQTKFAGGITKLLIRRLVCTFVVCMQQSQVFSRQVPNRNIVHATHRHSKLDDNDNTAAVVSVVMMMI